MKSLPNWAEVKWILPPPRHAIAILGCPKNGCRSPGWHEPNMVRYGEQDLMESTEGWCETHGPYRWAATSTGSIVEFDYEMIDWAAYVGLTREQLDRLEVF